MALIETIREERAEKLTRLREAGMDPYPARASRTHTVAAFLDAHPQLQESGQSVTIAGRMMSVREHGGAVFVDLFDGAGKAQAYLEKEKLGDAFDSFTAFTDTGDIVEITGMAFTTKRGQPSLSATSWRMLAKSLRPVPDEWYGIKDEDERYRKRYLDILLSKDIRDRIIRRSAFWNAMRAFFLARSYIEVETPVLETTTGGAEARPFITHHNALDMEVYLRISAGELWQKRLMIAGIPKVFEIGRIFRNEGMSAEHAQDYTQLESYEAFSDYREGMKMIMDLYRTVAKEVFGTLEFDIRGHKVDLGAEWQTYDFNELMRKEYGLDPREQSSGWGLALENRGLPFEPGESIERLVDVAWKQLRKTLTGPGFLINVPVYMEPLAKKSSEDDRVVERFQVLIAGSEVGKGFSELNDPVDQAERFKRQGALRAAGDEEAQMPDAEYVEAMEYGMPPAFGFGVSERLFSFLEGVSIREAQIFPLMRPREESQKSKENKAAVAVVNKSGLESWQVLNTVGHLAAELGIREGRKLLSQESIRTMDDVTLPLNMQHALMLKETQDTSALKDLFIAARERGLQVEVFTREMLETTSDKKVIERTAGKNLADVEFLGVLVFGPVSDVEALTSVFSLYS